MLAIYTVLGTSLIALLFGVFTLIVLWNEGVKYRRFALDVIKMSLAAPVLYGLLVFILAFAEYPLGW